MRTGGVVQEVLKAQKPTMIFAVPYSGHQWSGFGGLRKQPEGAKMDCMLTKDYKQLAAAIRPFRAIHHLREARILNVTTRSFDAYANSVKDKFGTEIKRLELQRVVDAYKAVDNNKAEVETRRWIKGAEKVVEPPREEIFKSCKLALAFEKMLEEEDATVITVDCYGTMWDKTIKLPANNSCSLYGDTKDGWSEWSDGAIQDTHRYGASAGSRPAGRNANWSKGNTGRAYWNGPHSVLYG
jgi:hypothetical protein